MRHLHVPPVSHNVDSSYSRVLRDGFTFLNSIDWLNILSFRAAEGGGDNWVDKICHFFFAKSGGGVLFFSIFSV